MRLRAIMIFLATAGIALFAAGQRFGDSGHAIAMLSKQGGKVRHGFQLAPHRDLYTLIVTGTVLPPLRGDARIELAGETKMRYAIYTNPPIVDLGLYRKPQLSNGVLTGLQPFDRFALWVVMHPVVNEDTHQHDTPVLNGQGSDQFQPSQPEEGPLSLNFYAVADHRPLLKIPISFGSSTGGHHGE